MRRGDGLEGCRHRLRMVAVTGSEVVILLAVLLAVGVGLRWRVCSWRCSVGVWVGVGGGIVRVTRGAVTVLRPVLHHGTASGV